MRAFSLLLCLTLNRYGEEDEKMMRFATGHAQSTRKQTKAEEKLLKDLADHLSIAGADAKRIATEARSRAEKLASKL